MSTTTTTTLILVDCQNDFHPGGSLAIPTANDDAQRIAQFIRDHPQGLHRIVATLDTHQKLHIAHPCFWVHVETGEHPPPFTILSAQELKEGKTWKPRSNLTLDENVLDPAVFDDCDSVMTTTTTIDDKVTDKKKKKKNNSIDLEKYCIAYAERLEAKGRFQICIWPEHCLIGTHGHAMVDVIQQACAEWTETTGRSVEWCWKGQHILTEMYSALEADVPTTVDTRLNRSLLASWQRSDRVWVCGQAMSHCVNYTVRDLVEHWPAGSVDQVGILTDCASAVPGFEAAAETFLQDMKAKGVVLKKAAEVSLSSS
mmetsp:Transcript_4359/g.11979  ORF Transcript_4359/g.11979 Transcript_4359/m.11979 type:complete len:313 (-) Transcript_4359:127-1065(-)